MNDFDDDDELSSSSSPSESSSYSSQLLPSQAFNFFLPSILAYSKNLLEIENSSNPSSQNKILLSDITTLLSKIKSNQLNISEINLSLIDKDITNAIQTILLNLKKIIMLKSQNFKMHKFFKINRKLKLISQIDIFLKNQFQLISKGTQLYKLNFTSSGRKLHFYRIDKTQETFEIRNENKEDTITGNISLLLEINKITYGVSSNNLKQVILCDNESFGSKWKYLSVILNSRSIDLCVNKIQTNNNLNETKLITAWFYGFIYFYRGREVPYKIPSTTKFVFSKLKYKIIDQLHAYYKVNNNGNATEKIIAEQLINEKGINKLSFIKLLLFYNKFIYNNINN